MRDLDAYVPPTPRRVLATPETWQTISPEIRSNPVWKVDDGVYAGPRPRSVAEMDQLKALGVKTLLTVEDFLSSRLFEGWRVRDARKVERRQAESVGLGFVEIPVSPVFPVPRSTIIRTLQTLSDENLQPVYLHCRFGRERTSMLAALHKLAQHETDAHEAVQEMVEHRYRAHLTPILHAQFRGWSQAEVPANTPVQRILKSTVSASTAPITEEEVKRRAS